ncbi:MAG TPA: DNA replication and repair protein RecF [Flavipsychrobacter sp.]|nr:DNA replication and repair protein RecF [Flavipsychrobacter sp.]
MSALEKITLTQFRNYQYASFEFDAPIICITGLNGVGKTNLLDAIYYLCYTKSYFTGYQQYLSKLGCDGFRLEGVFAGLNGTESVSCKWQNGKKEIFQNDVLCENVKDYIGKHTAVMIAPDDVEIINEGSEVRRKWVDGILAQTDKVYFDCLLKYQQVLAQRNAWLKMNAVKAQHDFSLMDFYDSILAETGTYIHQARKTFIEKFITHLVAYYEKLSGGVEQITIRYHSEVHQTPLAGLLKNSLSNDLALQRTLKGVHKDDFEFVLNGRLIRQFGSQGQKKTYLFALKLAQYRFLQTILGLSPVLLLDDIFEKLDNERLAALLSIIEHEDIGQVFLTDIDAERIKKNLKSVGDITNILLK